MTTSHYDVVVAGTDLAGVILAALCAKRGYRTLLAGNGSLPNRYLRKEQTFYRRTEFLVGFENSQPIQEVMGGLSMALHMRGRPKKREESYQVISPEGRVTVTGSASTLAKHLEREYGEPVEDTLFPEPVQEEMRAIDRFIASEPLLPPDGWNERREFQKSLELHPRIAEPARLQEPLRFFRPGTALHRFWKAPLEATSSMDLELAAPLPRTRCLQLLQGGVFEVDGGGDALRDAFIGKVRQYSCDYRPEIQFGALQVKRGRVSVASVQDRREAIGCDFIVCAGPEKPFFNMIAPEDRKERYHHRIHSLVPSKRLFTVNLVLKEGGIPLGMARHVFLVGHRGKGGVVSPSVHLMVSPGVEGTAVVTASTAVAGQQLHPTVSAVKSRIQNVLMRVREQVMPFLDEHLLELDCPWLRKNPLSGEMEYAAGGVEELFPGHEESLLRDSPIEVETGYKNVLVCNRNTHSGLGLEGSYLSALNSFRLVESRMPLKSPLR